MEILQDIPLPMGECYHSKNYTSSEESLDCAVGSPFLSDIEIDCLQQSMESALKRLGQESRKKKQPKKLRIFRYYMPCLEEIKEHDEQTEMRNHQKPKLDLTSLHKERAMNEGHLTRYSRSSRKTRGLKTKA